MKKIFQFFVVFSVCVLLVKLGGLPFGCGNDANNHGVGSECTTNEDCTEEGQECLNFKGGYCGIQDCVSDNDCPEGSACVAHDDGINYCFLLCNDKPDCNDNRSAENEANCSASITFVDSNPGEKACVPPSADTTL